MQSRVKWLTEVSLLAVFIVVTGMFKLPSLLPGAEFQLSAPLAVAICAVFGFKKYITAGVIASAAGLILGTQTLLNVIIALVFRVVVGLVLAVFGRSYAVIILAGPIASACARTILGLVIGKAVIPLVAAAVPGMIFTALLSWPMTSLLKRVRKRKDRG